MPKDRFYSGKPSSLSPLVLTNIGVKNKRRLIAMAESQGRRITEIARQAIVEYIEQYEKEHGPLEVSDD